VFRIRVRGKSLDLGTAVPHGGKEIKSIILMVFRSHGLLLWENLPADLIGTERSRSSLFSTRRLPIGILSFRPGVSAHRGVGRRPLINMTPPAARFKPAVRKQTAKTPSTGINNVLTSKAPRPAPT
jgi:hypothetical protein